ncbi:MAG: efflux RND transporter periplasmic adaptor subunit, partial [Pseudomonadota bacterium]
TTQRRYPGVIEPSDITTLSFDVGGKLEEVSLSVGQRVEKGAVLAQLDLAQFEIDVRNKEAALQEAEVLLEQDQADFARQETLLQRGSGTRLARDEARTDLRASEARLRQAQEALKAARQDLEDAVLVAPFAGIVNSVDADSFATVSAGTAIASIYDASSYEVSFSVNFDTVSALVVGTPARVRLADDPDTTLDAVVSELGERADTVSSFPVIVQLRETTPLLRAGMAVEVALEFSLPAEAGFLVPMSAAIPEGELPERASPTQVSELELYVFDPNTSQVARRAVRMAGIRENKLLVIDGLEAGERIAIAGVTFLRDGMTVKLLETEE